MDLISRQAVIDALEEKKTYSTAYKDGYTQTDYFKQYNMGLTDGIKAIKALPSAQPDVPDINVGDMISRQVALKEIEEWISALYENAHHESASDGKMILNAIKHLPPAQPEDWMEQNKDRILKAGMEGREVEFRIGGRLFAIREKAQ